jgi:hypothetical protein
MAIFKCVCGNVLANSICPNDIQLIVFTDREWEAIQEKVLTYTMKYHNLMFGVVQSVKEFTYLKITKWF